MATDTLKRFLTQWHNFSVLLSNFFLYKKKKSKKRNYYFIESEKTNKQKPKH